MARGKEEGNLRNRGMNTRGKEMGREESRKEREREYV